MNNGDSIQLLYNGRILMSNNASPLKSTKRVQRHRRKIEIDKLLQNVEEKERRNILNSSIAEFSEKEASDPVESFNNAIYLYIKKKLNNARRSRKSKLETSILLSQIFGEKLSDEMYQSWFIKQFNMKNKEEMISLLNAKDNIDARYGCDLLPQAIRQEVYHDVCSNRRYYREIPYGDKRWLPGFMIR